MSNTYLISKSNGKLQMPYGEYLQLMEKVEERQRLEALRDSVVSKLLRVLDGSAGTEVPVATAQPARKETPKASPAKPAAAPAPEPRSESKPAAERTKAEGFDVPPIKKDIAQHFNKLDESGRLFNVFKQYYTCLNDSCGGTVRVTMKDGVCSLWNYDEWEEFAFVDLSEGHLRISLDPRYTECLKSLDFCEVPRVLSSRRSLVSVQVDDLNNTMLGVLAKAFAEVGMATN